VDLDALAAARAAEWQRLGELSSRRRLTGAEADELVGLYQSASADLAEIKSAAGRAPQGDVVSTLLAAARLRLTRASANPLRALPRFFAVQLPAALYRVRWTTLVIAAVFVAVVVTVAAWVAGDPALVAALGDRAGLQYYAEEEFTSYYSENPAAVFAGTVWTNNAWIAAQCVLFGITGFWPVMVLIQNAVGLGMAAAVMFAFDRGDVFVLFILPHGLLELTCIFVAGAAGLHIFWAWVAPGPRRRADALAAAGRSLATIAIGMLLALLVSGIIEGFVTAQPWPWPIKIGIGAAALAAFVFYMVFVGGRAARAGETGDLSESEVGTPTLVSG
jgi:uncharacterized membrane protein SpoIIM required for sporulation